MKKIQRRRNKTLVDMWSLTHIAWGVLLGILVGPVLAIILLVLWEPIENFIISPIMHRIFGINFGHESLQNSISDIVFDLLGVMIAVLITP
jgi:hypothetical protein